MKLFKIKKKRNKKYPYKIKHTNGAKIPVPSQYDFDTYDINTKGCIIVAFYMAQRFIGKRKTVMQCLKYMQKNHPKGKRLNYNLKQVAMAINELKKKDCATYYDHITKTEMKQALRDGKMVLFTEREPIHTVVLLYNGYDVIRFSDGKYNKTSWIKEIEKRCNDNWYKGCVVVKRR